MSLIYTVKYNCIEVPKRFSQNDNNKYELAWKNSVNKFSAHPVGYGVRLFIIYSYIVKIVIQGRPLSVNVRVGFG